MIAGILAATAMLMVGSAKTEAPPKARCDVRVEFKQKDGRSDAFSYREVKAWISLHPELVLSATETPLKNRAGSEFCIVTTSKDAVKPAFTGLKDVIGRYWRGSGVVTLRDRFGGSFKRAAITAGRVPNVPRDNGIRERPPIGNRN